MDGHLEKTLTILKERFGLPDGSTKYPLSLVAGPEQILEVARTLRDELSFKLLSDITAVDYYPEQTPRFHIIYNFYSLEHNVRVCIRVPLDGENPSVHTLEGLYHSANWQERELWDMFGIQIEAHSDLRRVLMPYDWVGHPLRKDYPLGYEEPQFTFNFEEIERRKHKARYEEA